MVKSADIQRWFTHGPAAIPADCMVWVASRFMNDMVNKGLTVCILPHKFMSVICEALCVYRHAMLEHKQIKGPHRIFPKPLHWSHDIEYIWLDYIGSRVCNEQYWDSFWNDLPEQPWENDMHAWRSYFQAFMGYYIQRDLYILVDQQLLYEDKDGEVHTGDAYESDNEYDTY